jgi:REP element-mobilizing transposase RayT
MDDEVPPIKRWANHPRLTGFSYDGEHAYHVVFNTNEHRPLLVGDLASLVETSVIAAAAGTHHELLAFVVMPNHVHALVQGERPDTDVVAFVARAKQRPGYSYRRRTGDCLWLPSFYDRIVRRGDDAREIAAYILDNPVRAGLIRSGEVWPFSGGTLVDSEIGRG